MRNPQKSKLFKISKPLEFDAAILNGFPLVKRPVDRKIIVCLRVARCSTRPRLSRTNFISNMAFTKQVALEQPKQQHKASTRTKKMPRKSNKWMKTLTTDPVPHSEMSLSFGKCTDFSFTVLVSSWVFCPKFDISVK